MILDKLKENPKPKPLLLITLIGFAIFISMTLAFSMLTSGMTQFATYGVLDFELAWTAEQINIIFAVWGAEGMQIQALAVYLDFLYIHIIAYAFINIYFENFPIYYPCYVYSKMRFFQQQKPIGMIGICC